MRRDDRIRLQHMFDGAREALSFVQERRREDLDSNRLLVLGLVKAIEIIGEAAYQVSESTRAEVPSIPWEDIVGMRPPFGSCLLRYQPGYPLANGAGRPASAFFRPRIRLS